MIYFKNGRVLRGQVVEYESNGDVKIRIYGESTFVYKSLEILKLEKETIEVAKEIKEAKGTKRPNHKVQCCREDNLLQTFSSCGAYHLGSTKYY